jgi:hypothetical protein
MMKYTALKSTLNLFGKDTVEVIKKDIRYKKLIDTGRLLGSITYKIYKSNNGFEIDFFMVDYGKYVDEGTRYIKAREFFIRNIDLQYKKWSDKITEAVSQDAVDDLTESLKKL